MRFGIIGTGNIAVRFARSMAFVENAELYGVYGRTKEHVLSFAEKFNIPHTFDDVEALLDSGIDAVYVALPHGLHKDTAIKALNKGIAVLCEKPAGLNSEEVEEMVHAAKENNTLFMEAMKTRFEPAYIELKKQVHSGSIGKVKKILLSDCFRIDPSMYGHTYHTEKGQGGCLLDCGCYCLSWAEDYAGIPEHVNIKEAKMMNGVDMYVNAELVYPDCTIDVECGFDRKQPQTAVLMGTDGTVEVDMLHRPQGYLLCSKDNEKDISLPAMHDDMYGEIAHFVKLLENGKKESDVMTYAASLNIAKISDMIRIALNNDEHCVNVVGFEKK